jgi:hypothetical protein
MLQGFLLWNQFVNTTNTLHESLLNFVLKTWSILKTERILIINKN